MLALLCVITSVSVAGVLSSVAFALGRR